MSAIKTLREFSGLSNNLPSISDCAVIVVDAQKEYTQGLLPLFEIDKSISALSDFLNIMRQRAIKVIHVVQVGKVDGKIFNAEGSLSEIIDEVKPIEGEIVIEKRFPSSFTGTNLHEVLQNLNVKNLIITGYMTHMCVNSTVRSATELGYNCIVPQELTTTRDLPDGKGGVVSASIVKSVHLAGLADRFAIVCSVKDLSL